MIETELSLSDVTGFVFFSFSRCGEEEISLLHFQGKPFVALLFLL
jgi:hypothetical protein